MNTIKLFVADADQEHIRRTRRAIDGRQELTFMGSSAHGQMAFRRLMAESADILMLDLQLPGMDGLTLLRALNRQAKCPVCIVCTCLYSDVFVTCAVQCGAHYVLYKPLDYECLPGILIRCCQHFRPDLFPGDTPCLRPPSRSLSLTALGFPAGQRGTRFIREALNLLRERPELLRNMSKGLYAAIAEKTNATPGCVERAIRHAIAIACERGVFLKIFSRRPTNRELFNYLLSIRLDNSTSSDLFVFDD